MNLSPLGRNLFDRGVVAALVPEPWSSDATYLDPSLYKDQPVDDPRVDAQIEETDALCDPDDAVSTAAIRGAIASGLADAKCFVDEYGDTLFCPLAVMVAALNMCCIGIDYSGYYDDVAIANNYARAFCGVLGIPAPFESDPSDNPLVIFGYGADVKSIYKDAAGSIK